MESMKSANSVEQSPKIQNLTVLLFTEELSAPQLRNSYYKKQVHKKIPLKSRTIIESKR